VKIIRSCKCSIKFTTKAKLIALNKIRNEYSNIVNQYINLYWHSPIKKSQLVKYELNKVNTWLSQRMKLQASREAIDMIIAMKNKKKDKNNKPTHRGKMQLSSLSCKLLHWFVEKESPIL